MIPSLPCGYRAAGVYSGVKRDANKLDLSLVVSDRPAVGGGVYTLNLVCAAPVTLGRGGGRGGRGPAGAGARDAHRRDRPVDADGENPARYPSRGWPVRRRSASA